LQTLGKPVKTALKKYNQLEKNNQFSIRREKIKPCKSPFEIKEHRETVEDKNRNKD
jgi:hypothetical protein